MLSRQHGQRLDQETGIAQIAQALDVAQGEREDPCLISGEHSGYTLQLYMGIANSISIDRLNHCTGY